MKINRCVNRAVRAAAIVLALAVGAAAQTDNFKPTDISDAGVGLAADFAVKEQAAKKQQRIALEQILAAEDHEPMLGARDFRLCLAVKTNGKPSNVQAMVSMDQYSNLKLLNWKNSNCGGKAAGDAFRVISSEDVGARFAADFAVKTRSTDKNNEIALERIVKAEDREPKLGERIFRLCMATKANGKAASVRAVVSMDQYSNLKIESWREMACVGK
ncbi:MAG: hypothetical protein IPM50_10270 [Acidobacteriota bacterium]|nr:MAG: hypothetical protein IPM50_10270 [Acidobacteriota bacterium]